MSQVVITLPVGKSNAYVQEYQVFSIQQNRKLLDKLVNGQVQFLGLREEKGGRMSVLYRLQRGGGLLLNPKQALAPQLRALGIVLSGKDQIRLGWYMKYTGEKLGDAYSQPQLFYLLEEAQALPAKPRPRRNGQTPLYFTLDEVLNNTILG